MSRYIRSLALISAFATSAVVAQSSVIPLVDRHYTYPGEIPYKVDTNPTGRGPQSGYTLCNSTTQNQDSLCQLAMINNISDFCLWGPPTANSTIADTEAATVAWCTLATHGTRVMPAGTITGIQVLIAPAYIQFSGTLNQQNVYMQVNDTGGEMDPHGADLRGNPLGSLVYSNAFPSNGNNSNSFQQVIEWFNFMGSDLFCFKICDPAVPNSKVFCNNIFDETGCAFVAPALYKQDIFEVCESDNMDPVGVYTGPNGVVSTYTQPAVVTSLPSIRTPVSSNCKTYGSTDVYIGGTTTGTSSSTTNTGSTKAASTGITTKATNLASGSSSTHSATTKATGNAAVRVRGLETTGLGVVPAIAIAVSLLVGLGTVIAGL